ncbi:MAG: hypothetical protein ISN64_01815 [Rickettsia sp.]|nr:hypothetical protein [Rickettsia sp.]
MSLFNITLTLVAVALFSATKNSLYFFSTLTPFIILMLILLINFSIWRSVEYKLKQIPFLEQRIRFFSESHKILESVLNHIDISISLREKNSSLKYTNYYFLKKDPTNIYSLEDIDKLSSNKISILNEIPSKKHVEIKEIIMNNKKYLYEFVYKQIDNHHICSTAYKIFPNTYCSDELRSNRSNIS